MGLMIEDGTGKGYVAKVDSDNRLESSSVSRTKISDISDHKGMAFSAYCRRNIAAADTAEYISYFINNGKNNVVVSKAVISAKITVYGTFEIYVDPTYVSGGDTVIPLNLNRTSSLASNVAVKHGRTTPLVLTITDANELICVKFQIGGGNTYMLEFWDALILGNGDSLGGYVKGGTIGDEFRLTWLFYEIEA